MLSLAGWSTNHDHEAKGNTLTTRSLTYWENTKVVNRVISIFGSGNTTTISIFLKQHKGTWRMPWL